VKKKISFEKRKKPNNRITTKKESSALQRQIQMFVVTTSEIKRTLLFSYLDVKM
jgi:hypothetical protein